MIDKRIIIMIFALCLLYGCSGINGMEGEKSTDSEGAHIMKNVIHVQSAEYLVDLGYGDFTNQLLLMDADKEKQTVDLDSLFGNGYNLSGMLRVEQFSTDGKRVLISKTETGEFEQRRTEWILDCQTKQILFEYSNYKDGSWRNHIEAYSPSLQYFLEYVNGNVQCRSIAEGAVGEVFFPGMRNGWRYYGKCYLFSPDETKIMCLRQERGNDATVSIIDLHTMQESTVLNVEQVTIGLCQWHQSGKLLHMQNEELCMLNMNDGTVTMIGKYMTSPLLLPDGNTLVFSQSKADELGWTDFGEAVSLGNPEEYGLYCLDLKTNERTRISENEACYAVNWFDSLELFGPYPVN